MSDLGSRFDWYEATFDTLDDDRVAPSLAIALGGTMVRSKGRNGYAQAWAIEVDDEVLATVYGHSARLGEVHISTTSESCVEVVPVLRRMYPGHRVSRADSAVDFKGDFDELDRYVVEFAEKRGLSSTLITNSDGGATRYVGSPRSETRMRLYKKTEELRQKHPERIGDVPDGILRAELVARPGKRAIKERLGHMASDDVWGLSLWAGELAAELLQIQAERVSTHFRRPSDWVRALHYLGLQYGPSIERRIEAVGGDRARAEVLAALGLDA